MRLGRAVRPRLANRFHGSRFDVQRRLCHGVRGSPARSARDTHGRDCRDAGEHGEVRGVNVFPEAVGAAIAEDRRSNGEFFCFVDRVGEAGVDQMDVRVEVVDPSADHAAMSADLELRLKEVLGVKVGVTLVGMGELDRYTGTSQASKVKRLLDRRNT